MIKKGSKRIFFSWYAPTMIPENVGNIKNPAKNFNIVPDIDKFDYFTLAKIDIYRSGFIYIPLQTEQDPVPFNSPQFVSAAGNTAHNKKALL